MILVTLGTQDKSFSRLLEAIDREIENGTIKEKVVVQAGLTNTEVMKSNIVRSVQQKIGTALYREYLRRMLDSVLELMEALKDDNPESESPDILKASSVILRSIFSENLSHCPTFIRELSLEDYFSEKVTGKYAIQTIKTAWQANPNAFEVNKRMNTLRYVAGENWDADRLMKELPENLCAKRSRDSVIMDLAAAKDFFDIDFKSRSLLSRLLGN